MGAFQSTSFLATNFDKNLGWYIKFYQTGSTTALPIGADVAGNVQYAKLEIDQQGYFVNDGGDIIIPHVQGVYDAFLFPTELEADNNDTSNAIRIANDVTAGALLYQNRNLIVATAGQTVFTLSFDYIQNNNNISVYKDGVRQNVGLAYDYTETGKSEVTLTSGATVGEEFTFVSNESVTTFQAINFVPNTFEAVTLVSGQTVATFSYEILYASVYLSGPNIDKGRIFEGEDYTATGFSITLNESYPPGTKVMVVQVDSTAL